MLRTYTRREAIRRLGAGGALAAVRARAQMSALPASTGADQPVTLQPIVDAAVARNDTAVRAVLPAQIIDPASPYRGSVPDAVGLHSAGSAGSAIDGATPLAGSTDAFLLERGTGTYRAGRNDIRFGPGTAPHRYAQVRGAEPKLAGPSVYLTGYTPFDHTLTIEGA